MANVRNNRRFKETEQRIQEAALDLADKEAKLTVRAICEQAQVNRSTFYAHFLDVPDMMQKVESGLAAELFERYLAPQRKGEPGPAPLSPESFIPFLEHIKQHRRFYRIALASQRNFPLEQGREELWNTVVEPLSKRAGITDHEHLMCLFVAFQAGFTMVLRRWTDSDCRMPVREMGKICASCVPRAWT